MAADLPKVTNAATESSMFRFLRGSATPSDMAVQRAANVFAPALRHIPRTRYTHLPATRDVTGKYTLDTLNPTHFHEMSINVASELCAAKGWRELLTRFWVAVLADPSKTRTAATKPKASSSPSGVRRWHRPTHPQGRLGPPSPPLGCGPTAATARYSSIASSRTTHGCRRRRPRGWTCRCRGRSRSAVQAGTLRWRTSTARRLVFEKRRKALTRSSRDTVLPTRVIALFKTNAQPTVMSVGLLGRERGRDSEGNAARPRSLVFGLVQKGFESMIRSRRRVVHLHVCTAENAKDPMVGHTELEEVLLESSRRS
jgi:hypothetical protein